MVIVEKKDYKTASKVAKALDLRRVKEWQTLALLIQVHDAAGDLEEAREVAVIAYNKNLGGRRLVYKLADICIRLKDYDEANELYKDYVKMAPRDPSRYVLEYKILKAQKAPAEDLIDVLETYREHEIDEKYLCELAYLYSNTGRIEECVDECDEIITLFRDGIYVDRAVQLKQQYAALSPAQEKILEEAARKAAKEALEQEESSPAREEAVQDGTKEIDLIQPRSDSANGVAGAVKETLDGSGEKAVSQTDDGDADSKSDEDDESAPKQGRFRSFISKTFLAEDDEEDDDEEDEDDGDEYEDGTEDDEADETDTDTGNAAGGSAVEYNKTAVNKAEAQAIPENSPNGTEAADVKEEAAVQPVREYENKLDIPDAGNVEDYAQSNAAIAAANASIQQMIEEAKTKIDDSYEQVQRQDEQERKEEEMSNISVPVRNYGIYDTQTLQAELVNSMNEIFSETGSTPDSKGQSAAGSFDDKEAVLPKKEESTPSVKEPGLDAEAVEEQIEGQLSIEDWIEAVREEKYSRQQTKEFSRAELERVLEKREKEHEEYEKLKAKMEEREDPIKSEREALARVIINAAKTDLAIRTGKATAKLEEDVRQARLERKARQEAERIRREQEAEAERKRQEEARLAELARRQAELERQKAEQEAERARLEREEEEAVRAVEEAIAQEIINEEAAAAREPMEDVSSQVNQTVKQVADDANDDGSREADRKAAPAETTDYSDSPMSLPDAVKRYFKKFEDVENLERILVGFYTEVVLRSSEIDSASGNMIISGNHSADKTGLAMSIVKGINVLFPEKPRKIARTTGESINAKGIVKAMSRLKGTVLIIEDAGSLRKSRVNELLELLEGDTGNMLVILEDSENDLEALTAETPELTEKFNHKIELKCFTVNEMVELAKRYALEQTYTIDDNALLALYLAMDRLNNNSDHIDVNDIYEVIDDAIANEHARNNRKLFRKKRGDNGNVLMEIDFSAE